MPSPIREFHRRNSPKTQYFVAYDTAGQPIVLAGATGRLSKDGGAFSDCTNLPTSIGRGLHSITLTAAESNADNLGLVVTALSTGYCPAAIISAAVLEMSQLNIHGSVTGSVLNITNSLLNSAGIAINMAATGGNVANITAHSASTNGLNFIGSFRGSHAINTTQWLGAGFCANGNDIGISLVGCGDAINLTGNSRKIINATHAVNGTPGIMVSGSVGNQMPLVHIIGQSTGRVPALKIETVPTGGGSAVEFKTNNYITFSLELAHANATGQCIKFGGYLPEPTMPIDKDTFTIMDAISFITASMTNRVALNKDTLIHTLYQRDNSSTLVSRGVSDDGTTQGMSATD